MPRQQIQYHGTQVGGCGHGGCGCDGCGHVEHSVLIKTVCGFSAIEGSKVDGSGGGLVNSWRSYAAAWWEGTVFEARLW